MNRLSQRTQYGGSPEGGQGGGYAGYWKIALYKRFSFNLFFFFFSQHCCVVLDLRCRFYDLVLKEVVFFFQEKQKQKSSHYECLFFLSLENLRVCYIPMFFHLKFTLPIKYSILGFFMFYCFSTKIQLDLFTHIGM